MTHMEKMISYTYDKIKKKSLILQNPSKSIKRKLGETILDGRHSALGLPISLKFFKLYNYKVGKVKKIH